MSDYPELVARLRVEEGVKTSAYRDSRGILTIGVGFNIDGDHGGGLDDTEIDFILAHRIALVADAAQRYPWFDGLSKERQMVVLDMMYNLGPEKFSLFHGTHHAIATGAWDQAALNMLNSLWARQVGKRADRLARIMRTNVWE